MSHPKAYMRERASALLQIGSGQYIKDVAAQGLLFKRDAHTLSDWVHRYQSKGIAGLEQLKGRGRKSSFSPPQ
jgi:transposase